MTAEMGAQKRRALEHWHPKMEPFDEAKGYTAPEPGKGVEEVERQGMLLRERSEVSPLLLQRTGSLSAQWLRAKGRKRFLA
jgi:hypothetical protein